MAAKKQKLLTYNPIKHPLVDKFFDSIDGGMQSHYMREAIEFYMKYKDSDIDTIQKPFRQSSAISQIDGEAIKKSDENSEYEDFNPNDL